jgi:hypothetical protein
MKLKEEEEIQMIEKAKVDGPDHCIHCNEDLCLFLQIELHLCEIDMIHYDEDQYANNPVLYNSGGR